MRVNTMRLPPFPVALARSGFAAVHQVTICTKTNQQIATNFHLFRCFLFFVFFFFFFYQLPTKKLNLFTLKENKNSFTIPLSSLSSDRMQ